MSARPESPRHGWRLLGILSALMGFASISTDLYLPAMPAMGKALGAVAGTVEWTISGYLVGFSVGQLFWGPIGDRYGRRLPVAIGLALFVLGSAGCALAGSIWAIIRWRIMQAFEACAGVVLAHAMVRDLYEDVRAAQMLSILMIVMATAPLLGPILGGQILAVADWRAFFGRWWEWASRHSRLLWLYPKPCRSEDARSIRCRTRSLVTPNCFEIAVSMPTPVRALVSTGVCSRTSPARHPPTSLITTFPRRCTG